MALVAIKGQFSFRRRNLQVYSKPHLDYADQVLKLAEHGLLCPDKSAAEVLLRSVGYYRLSAYVYPFRVMLAEGERKQESPAHYRSSQVNEGVSLDDVKSLWQFDRKLRLLCLDAIEMIEIGLRTRVAYVLGARDPFGHLTRQHLDGDACSALLNTRQGKRETFDLWVERYESLQEKAKSEDFVSHNLVKYGPPLPVWIGVEFLDMGALVRLYSLLDRRDQNKIAMELGVGPGGGRLLSAWLSQINYVRNLCAHHSRLWNRSLTYSTRNFSPKQVKTDLEHAADGGQREKIYVVLAIMAYLVRHIEPHANWPLTMRTQVRKFPEHADLSVERDMGFPETWDGLPLWARQGP